MTRRLSAGGWRQRHCPCPATGTGHPVRCRGYHSPMAKQGRTLRRFPTFERSRDTQWAGAALRAGHGFAITV